MHTICTQNAHTEHTQNTDIQDTTIMQHIEQDNTEQNTDTETNNHAQAQHTEQCTQLSYI